MRTLFDDNLPYCHDCGKVVTIDNWCGTCGLCNRHCKRLWGCDNTQLTDSDIALMEMWDNM